jgi:hypothetical protein
VSPELRSLRDQGAQTPLLQLPFAPQSLSWTHATQRWTSPRKSQSGVGAAQSAFVAHATHRPCGLQIFDSGVLAQSAFVTH